MSNSLLKLVWPLCLPSTSKLVLVALADLADDQGVCWPGMNDSVGRDGRRRLGLITRTSLSERAIQNAIKQLVEAGHLSRKEALGKGVTYTVHPRTSCAGAPASGAAVPPYKVRPAPDAPAQELRDSPASDAPNTSIPTRESPQASPAGIHDPEARRGEWNAMAAAVGLKQASKLSDQRRRMLRARIAEHGVEGWKAALGKVEASPFLQGLNGGWRADFDWLLKPTNFLKVLEGNYDPATPSALRTKARSARSGPTDIANPMVRAAMSRLAGLRAEEGKNRAAVVEQEADWINVAPANGRSQA